MRLAELMAHDVSMAVPPPVVAAAGTMRSA